MGEIGYLGEESRKEDGKSFKFGLGWKYRFDVFSPLVTFTFLQLMIRDFDISTKMVDVGDRALMAFIFLLGSISRCTVFSDLLN